jgi:hypothetical protein
MVQSYKLTRRSVFAGLGASALALDSADAQTVPETTMLFDTAAHFDPIRKLWVLPLHAWVYHPQQSTFRKGAIAALLKRTYGLEATAQNAPLFDARINVLLADNKRGRRPDVTVTRDALTKLNLSVTLPPTGPNGHVRQDVTLSAEPGSRLTLMPKARQEAFQATAHLIPPTGVSIVCDIDDTVKETGVLDKRRLWESTFFKPFSAVPGMATVIKRLAGAEAAVHYVSSSPWHLYQPLRSWLFADGFPVSSLHLKHIRLKDSTILDILKSPEETKPPIISGLLKRYPGRTFVLVGDSGEKDPEVYGAIARTFSKQVTRILIRRAPGDQSGAARFEQAFASLPRDLWQVFDDPSQVA